MNIRDSKENMVIDMAERLPKNTYRQASVAPLETYPSHQKNPHYDCCCNHHREARELLVSPGTTSSKNGTEFIDPSLLQSLAAMIGLDNATAADKSVLSQIDEFATHGASIPVNPDFKDTAAMHQDFVRIQEIITKNDSGTSSKEKMSRGVGSSIIGGCCCVDLSIEYLPSNILSETNCAVAVATMDTSGTICSWAQICGAQSGYEIRENIISTNPGARLVVVTLNLVARVRWCEHFAC